MKKLSPAVQKLNDYFEKHGIANANYVEELMSSGELSEEIGAIRVIMRHLLSKYESYHRYIYKELISSILFDEYMLLTHKTHSHRFVNFDTLSDKDRTFTGEDELSFINKIGVERESRKQIVSIKDWSNEDLDKEFDEFELEDFSMNEFDEHNENTIINQSDSTALNLISGLKEKKRIRTIKILFHIFMSDTFDSKLTIAKMSKQLDIPKSTIRDSLNWLTENQIVSITGKGNNRIYSTKSATLNILIEYIAYL